MNCSHVYEVRPGRWGHYTYCDNPAPQTPDGIALTVLGNPFCSVHYVNNLLVTDME